MFDRCFSAWLLQRYYNKRLQRVQNSLARVVCNAPYRSSSVPLLKSLHWLPIEQRIEYKIATMTYKLRLHHQPSYLFELINDYKPVRCLRSSSSALMKLPPLNKSRTQTAARAFSLASPKIWNSLPAAVRESTSLSTFRRLLKGHLFNVFEWTLDRPGASESLLTATKYGAVNKFYWLLTIDYWLTIINKMAVKLCYLIDMIQLTLVASRLL